MSGEHSSFVNENFDDLQSESSKDNLHHDQQETVDQSPSEVTTPTDTPLLNDTPLAEVPTGEERDEGVAVLHLSIESLGDDTPVPPEGGTTEEVGYNPFATTSSPMLKAKNTTSLVAPSSAVAPTDTENEPENSPHRPLPSGHMYESLAGHSPNTNELRHEITDEYDLQVGCCVAILFF